MTDREKKSRKGLWAVTLLTLAVIWGNSVLPASISGTISHTALELIRRIFGRTDAIREGDHLIRKMAHGLEYLVFGVECAGLIKIRLRRSWRDLLLCGLGAAFIDETIQLFSAGRAGQIRDVWIDLGGFACGVLLVFLLLTARKDHKPGTPGPGKDGST